MNLFGAEEACEPSMGSAPRLHCRSGEPGVRVCGCRLCILGSRLSSTAEWFLRAGDAPKRRFLTGLLLRCQSLDIVRNVAQLLQVTLGKDFTYARCQQRPAPSADLDAWSSDPSEVLSGEIRETWKWFSCSSNWTKANYVLGVFPLCDVSLLHVLGNLTRALLAGQSRTFLHHNVIVDNLEDHATSIPESHHSFYSDEHKGLDLLIRTSSNFAPLEYAWDLEQQIDFAPNPAGTDALKEASQSVSAVRRRDWSQDGDGNSLYSPDSARTAFLRASELLSGVSRYTDFIRRLPVHLAKRILALLDEPSLCSCLFVCRHWHYLAEEVQVESTVRRKMENLAVTMQANFCSGPNPVYARIREVLVPVMEEEEQLQTRECVSRTRTGTAFESVYAGVATRALQMEERNVYCGVFSVTVLSEQLGDDPLRVVHFCGGNLVAMGSRDKAVRLLDTKTVKPVMRPLLGHTGSVRVVLLSEERGLVLSAGCDLTIRCWSLQTGLCMKVYFGHTGTVNCLDLQEDLLVSGAKDCKVKVWNLHTGKCYKKLKFHHDKPILCVKIQKNLVLSGCDQGLLKVGDLETATILRAIAAHEGPLRCLFCDPWHILSGGGDGLVRAWSTSCGFEGSLMTFRHPAEVLSLAFLFLRVITGCGDGKIRIFSFLSGECLRVIRAGRQQIPVRSLHAHPDKIVVNTSATLVLLRFGTVHWNYTAAVTLPDGPEASWRPAVQEDPHTLAGTFRRTRPWEGSNAARRAAPPALSGRQVQGDIFGAQTESPSEARRENQAYCTQLLLRRPWGGLGSGSPAGGSLTRDADTAGFAKKWYRPVRSVPSGGKRAVVQAAKISQHSQRPEPQAQNMDMWESPPTFSRKNLVVKSSLPQKLCLPAPPAGMGIGMSQTEILQLTWTQIPTHSGASTLVPPTSRKVGLPQRRQTARQAPPSPHNHPNTHGAGGPAPAWGSSCLMARSPHPSVVPPTRPLLTPSAYPQPHSWRRSRGCGCEPSGSRRSSGRGGAAHSGGEPEQ
ncbi:F-box and WD repeat domain containing protein 10B [Brienomyrus brachyistius]|uniref:F-box and WD repeat domain containing protein 10B n=1 Tax=Brienomyrus brachyistius TaxID=42636 RepID=UPI0020B2F627|nr:F-box and WD repeat domain containing protein 10B [Brienomyrus brachyistius]